MTGPMQPSGKLIISRQNKESGDRCLSAENVTGHCYIAKVGKLIIAEVPVMKGKTADIENTVLTSVLKMAELVAGSFKMKKSVMGNCSLLEKEMADIDKELMQMAAKKMALYDDYKNGKHTREEFVAKSEAMRERMELCGERQAEIKDQIEEINRLSDTNEEMKMLDEMLGMTSFELERIKQVVDKVIVHAPDELEIVYKANNFIREMVEVG